MPALPGGIFPRLQTLAWESPSHQECRGAGLVSENVPGKCLEAERSAKAAISLQTALSDICGGEEGGAPYLTPRLAIVSS